MKHQILKMTSHSIERDNLRFGSKLPSQIDSDNLLFVESRLQTGRGLCQYFFGNVNGQIGLFIAQDGRILTVLDKNCTAFASVAKTARKRLGRLKYMPNLAA